MSEAGRTSIRTAAARGLLALVLAGWMLPAPAQSPADALETLVPEEPSPMADATGRELMDAVYARHQPYPFVFEEQSMVLIDRNGNRETRKLRRYSRVEEDGSARFLLLFDSPPEVEGVALLAQRTPEGAISKKVYLPALGPVLVDAQEVETGGQRRDAQMLGSDFSVENVTGEILDDYQYVRRRDITLDEVPYFVVDVYARGADPEQAPPLRRHYILQNGLYITRTDHLDELGRLARRQTHHDLTAVNEKTWRANMMLMVNQADTHRTLIKIDRRVYSPQYVPEDVFTAEWLYQNAPPLPAEEQEAGDEEAEPAVPAEPDAEEPA